MNRYIYVVWVIYPDEKQPRFSAAFTNEEAAGDYASRHGHGVTVKITRERVYKSADEV